MGDKYAVCWFDLRNFLHNYKSKHEESYVGERYCVALSIDDILAKMKEIEKEYT